MIKSNILVRDLQNREPLRLRSILDYPTDEDAEAALHESIHCISALKCPLPHQPSLVDWCLSDFGLPEPQTRTAAVARELRRLKSLKSFEVLDAEATDPTNRRGLNITSNSARCLQSNYKCLDEESVMVGTGALSSRDKGHDHNMADPSEPAKDPSSMTSTLNRLVDMATSMFSVCTAVISVTDMERQKILASKGFDEGVQELPRAAALGAHVVYCPEDTVVVPDLTLDERFQCLQIGTSRFYASVPLVTPEGERIGAFCLLDGKARPGGLAESELQLLHHMGGLAMQSMLERRTRLNLEKKLQSATRVVSATVHDLLTPLTAIELALSLLHEDQDLQDKLSEQQRESVNIASNCVGVLGQMCRTMRDEHSASCKRQVDGSTMAGSLPIAVPSTLMQLPHADEGLSADSFRIIYGTGKPGKETEDGNDQDSSGVRQPLAPLFETNVVPVPRESVSVQDLVKSIHMAADAIPKTIPVSIAVVGSVPPRIVTNDLKVLRCALNLLEHCATISSSGSVLLSIKPQYCCCGKAMLGFHCVNRISSESSCTTDSNECIRSCCSTVRAPVIKEESDLNMSTTSTLSTSCPTTLAGQLDCCHRHGAIEQRCLRNCSEVNLYSVAMLMDALGGDCGLDNPAASDSCECGDKHDGGSFWFRIPLVEPPGVEKDEERSEPGLASTQVQPKMGPSHSPESQSPKKVQPMTVGGKEASGGGLEDTAHKRKALIIEDSIVIRKVIANALSKIGFETEMAVNGMEGLHHLQCSTYDVVLCDFLMPVMDGMDCVTQYRDWEKIHRPYFHQYIIGMSAHASDQDVARALKIGMDSYKPKPLTYKGLKNIIDACEREQQLSVLIEETPASKTPVKTTNPGPSYDSQQAKMCLIAARDKDSFDLARLTEARGWKSLIVHDGEDALHALKKRNWDAVVLDEKLPLLNGKKTVQEFRKWESENRVNCQTNVYMLTASIDFEVPSTANGMLAKPVKPKVFEELLQRAEEPSLNIIMR